MELGFLVADSTPNRDEQKKISQEWGQTELTPFLRLRKKGQTELTPFLRLRKKGQTELTPFLAITPQSGS